MSALVNDHALLAQPRAVYRCAHVRCCVTPTGGVLLDLRHNRYYGLPHDQATWLARALNEQRLCEPLPPWLQTLISRGLIAGEPPTQELPSPSIDVRADLNVIGDGQRARDTLSLAMLARFVMACAWARYSIKHRSLYDTALRIARWKPHHATLSVEEAVCQFRRLRPFVFAAREHCLFHALALLHFLHQHGHRAYWVIGVNASPWGAHSWVQTDEAILDGTPEQVRLYTPIFAI